MGVEDRPVVVRFAVTCVIDPERFAEEYGDDVATVREHVAIDVAMQLMAIVDTGSAGGLTEYAHWLKTRAWIVPEEPEGDDNCEHMPSDSLEAGVYCSTCGGLLVWVGPCLNDYELADQS